MRKQTGSSPGDAFRSLSRGRTGPSAAVCSARAGSVEQGFNCLGSTVWELSRASPAWLRWMLPDSSAAVFFPCDCLAEHSHLAEGEREDVRNQPGPEQLQQPAHELLPDVAMANSLGNVAAHAFISGLRLLVGKCGTWNIGEGPAPSSLALRVTWLSCC